MSASAVRVVAAVLSFLAPARALAQVANICVSVNADACIYKSRNVQIGDTVTFTNQVAAAGGCAWTLRYRPEGSAATLVGTACTGAGTHLVADREGSYLVKLAVTPSGATAQRYAAIVQARTGMRIPAGPEGNEEDATNDNQCAAGSRDGWTCSVNRALQIADKGARQDRVACIASGAVSAGWPVAVVGSVALTTGEATPEPVAQVVRALADTEAHLAGLMFADAAISSGAVGACLRSGMVAVNTSALGAALGQQLYVTDTGGLSVNAGTVAARAGFVTVVGDGTAGRVQIDPEILLSSDALYFASTPNSVATSGVVGTSRLLSRGDHVHSGVDLSNAQTIGGAKDFTSRVRGPTGSAGTPSFEVGESGTGIRRGAAASQLGFVAGSANIARMLVESGKQVVRLFGTGQIDNIAALVNGETGASLTINSSPGGTGTASLPGGPGGDLYFQTGAGGDGTPTQAAGSGATTRLLGSPAGANGGGGGAVGGSIGLAPGSGSGAGANGKVQLAPLIDAAHVASSIDIGNTTDNTPVTKFGTGLTTWNGTFAAVGSLDPRGDIAKTTAATLNVDSWTDQEIDLRPAGTAVLRIGATFVTASQPIDPAGDIQKTGVSSLSVKAKSGQAVILADGDATAFTATPALCTVAGALTVSGAATLASTLSVNASAGADGNVLGHAGGLPTWQVPTLTNYIGSATGTSTTGSPSFERMNGTAISPSAGTYLLIFTASADRVEAGTIVYALFKAGCGGTEFTESERSIVITTLVGAGAHTIATSTIRQLVASTTYEICWKSTAGTASVYQRTLSLVQIGPP